MSVFSVMEESETVGHNGLDQQNCIRVYEGDESYADIQGATSDIITERKSWKKMVLRSKGSTVIQI